jgi:hypothetical protein
MIRAVPGVRRHERRAQVRGDQRVRTCLIAEPASAAVGYNLQFVGQAEDEIRIDAEDALGAIEGLDVRRVFSGWGFYRRGLLFAAAWEGEFRFRTRQGRHWIYELLTESCWGTPTSLSALRAGSLRSLRPNRQLPGPAKADQAQRVAGDSGHSQRGQWRLLGRLSARA